MTGVATRVAQQVILVLALGFSMPDAVGTSLIVIAVNSTVALATTPRGDSANCAEGDVTRSPAPSGGGVVAQPASTSATIVITNVRNC